MRPSPNDGGSGNIRFRADIQGLRGVAVLLVVFFHARIFWFQGGYIGVDIFYVISGYLITGLLLREIERTGTLRFVDFYARRARRLVPAAAVVLAATTGVAAAVYAPVELKQFTSSAVAAAVYISNFWFAHLSTDYLGEGTATNALLHTWSLGVEEQFYLVWPLLLLAVARMGPSASRRRRLFQCLGIVGVLSLVLSIWLTAINQPWAFFGSPTRAWEFSAGAMISLWRPGRLHQRPDVAAVMGLIGFLTIAAAATLFTDRTAFPGYAAVAPVLGAMLVIAAGHLSPDTGVGRLLGTPVLRFTGDISYSLYLWHWPLFVLIGVAFPDAGRLATAAGLAITLVFAWLTYVLVENPVRFNRKLGAHAYLSIVLAGFLIASTAGLAMTARITAKSFLATAPYDRYLRASQAIPDIYGNGCHADIVAVDPLACAYGKNDAAVTVVLFGDSHAAQWYPALKKLADRKGWLLISLTKSGCPSMDYTVFLDMLDRPYTECDAWRERALAKIRDIRPTLTILANSFRNAVRHPDEGGGVDTDGWRRAVRTTLAALAASSAVTAILKDTPWLPFNAPICLSRAAWHREDPDRVCEFDSSSQMADSIFDIESAPVPGADAVYAVDMTDMICPHRRCVVERDGLVLYRDNHHLTPRFVEYIADALYDRLEPIIEGARQPRQKEKEPANIR